jgi:hypothetical protein
MSIIEKKDNHGGFLLTLRAGVSYSHKVKFKYSMINLSGFPLDNT